MSSLLHVLSSLILTVTNEKKPESLVSLDSQTLTCTDLSEIVTENTTDQLRRQTAESRALQSLSSAQAGTLSLTSPDQAAPWPMAHTDTVRDH